MGLATITGLRVSDVPTENWPGTKPGMNATSHLKFITRYYFYCQKGFYFLLMMTNFYLIFLLFRSSMDTYVACTWVASLVALLFGVFKCRSFAEVLFGLSETDAQLELQEKHYEKIKRKSLYWIAFLGINKNLQIMGKCRTFISTFVHSNPLILISGLLLAGHTVAFYQMYTDSVGFDILLSLSDTLAHSTIFVLDLQFLYLVMVLCKRYRTMNKILTHITRVSRKFIK